MNIVLEGIGSFSKALDAIKNSMGNVFIRRAPWPNKNAAVFKAIYNGSGSREIVFANIEQDKFDDYVFGDGSNVVPFTPNNMDMMADDWEIYRITRE